MALTQLIVQELLDYDPETGILTWRIRDRKWFKDDAKWKMWNKRFAGHETGSAAINQGYGTVVLLSQHYQAHRVVWFWMTGEWPAEIDHKNHKRSDNRWVNLCAAERTDNRKNLSRYANNISGVCGIRQRYGKWQAHIRVNGYLHHLGCFENETDAFIARKSAEITYGFHENHGRP